MANDKILPVDVDGTIIQYMSKGDVPMPGDIFPVYGGKVVHLRPMSMNIALLKHHKDLRGYEIIVWSANGKEWAVQIIKELQLESYIDIVMTKPNKYVDDVDVNEWMPSRIHLEDK
jgi:hypothetical protein